MISQPALAPACLRLPSLSTWGTGLRGSLPRRVGAGRACPAKLSVRRVLLVMAILAAQCTGLAAGGGAEPILDRTPSAWQAYRLAAAA
jgi:hypothetical protein